ncbi:hypothetical protein RchiOBHm_Chr4g0417801 [Rosa chinensis]|uniref:Uncharacterized protein n=1 Tax=Rosa chinensis TaxID=74649 RepID=A0A2P6QX85_ROSCH|nr:hypothetical protein RchiOBHm_Chr4g0417801 [Rosa chinensis]
MAKSMSKRMMDFLLSLNYRLSMYCLESFSYILTKITELVVSRSDVILLKKALLSLATDSGLHPLVPY